MDILPTLAHYARTSPPDDRVIDGHDIHLIMEGCEGAKSPYDAFYYYSAGTHELHAVRSGPWKLHLLREELYHLRRDISEEQNVYEEHPEVVGNLEKLADKCREDLGDAHTNIEGSGCRPAGRVKDPETFTSMDEVEPYLRAVRNHAGTG